MVGDEAKRRTRRDSEKGLNRYWHQNLDNKVNLRYILDEIVERLRPRRCWQDEVHREDQILEYTEIEVRTLTELYLSDNSP